MDFKTQLKELRSDVDTYLAEYLGNLKLALSQPGLKDLFEAMEYSLCGGGNRIRPALCFFTAEALKVEHKKVMPFAAAVEMIHTYSLIHDDLPSMDNDDFRRGKPSNHKAFGEALAVLAGDALNTEAFSLIAEKYESDPKLALELVSELSRSAGARGMAGGQAVDILFKKLKVDQSEVEFLHFYKTGALFRASMLGVAHMAQPSPIELRALTDYAKNFGLVFQIADDLQESPGRAEPSFVQVAGRQGAIETCHHLALKAQASLEVFESRASGLFQLIDYIIERIQK